MTEDTNKEKKHLIEYLQRIRFPLPADGSLPGPTLKTLWQVHRLHALNIAFENLTFVHHKLKASERPVDLASLHKRVVHGGRGGMCQEMNPLLFANLKRLGFNCYQGMASVVLADSLRRAGAPFECLVSSKNLGDTIECMGTHQIIFTCVDGAWHLCDVGFGGLGIAEPILVQAYDEAAAAAAAPTSSSEAAPANDHHQQQQQQQEPWAVLPGAAAAAAAGCPGESHQCGSKFRLRRGVIGSAQLLPAHLAASHPEALSHVGWYLQCLVKDAWVDVYYFTRTLVTQPVISACAEASFRKHPLFNNHMIVTKPLEDGRATLMDWVLKVRRNGEVVEKRELGSEEERDAVLAEVFGIDLDNGWR